jgi:hypothetical protein
MFFLQRSDIRDLYMTTYIIAHNIKFPKSLSCWLSLSSLAGDLRFVIPACPESPASFMKERFPTSGNDKKEGTCSNSRQAGMTKHAQ